VDTTLFNPQGEPASEAVRQLVGRPILVYSGSIGTWYLLDEMLAFFARATRHRPDLHLLALSPSDHERIRAAAHDHGLRPEQLTIRRDHYQNVARDLRACAAGIAFIRPVASKDGSSPTKIAEYLACGLPVIVNAGVGDLAAFVEQEGVGVVLRTFEEDELERGARFLAGLLEEPGRIRERCVATARRLFDLESVGVERYHALYRRLGAA
jgi:glycosyltransferase involved in cell wall biosynthesis